MGKSAQDKALIKQLTDERTKYSEQLNIENKQIEEFEGTIKHQNSAHSKEISNLTREFKSSLSAQQYKSAQDKARIKQLTNEHTKYTGQLNIKDKQIEELISQLEKS